MTLQDDRTDAQRRYSHTAIIAGQDTFLSGWGGAEGGLSYAGWACEDKDIEKVFEWVEARSDMRLVKEVDDDYRPAGAVHFHIYVVEAGHPALN